MADFPESRQQVSLVSFDGNAQAPDSASWWLNTSWFNQPSQTGEEQQAVGGAVTQNRFNGNCAIPSFQQHQYHLKNSQNARRTGEEVLMDVDKEGNWEFDFDSWTWIFKTSNSDEIRIQKQIPATINRLSKIWEEEPIQLAAATNLSQNCIPNQEIIDFTNQPVQIYVEQKRKIWETVVLPLLNPQIFDSLGVQIGCPSMMVTGPPGSGKSTLIKQTAQEFDLSIELISNQNEIQSIFKRSVRKTRPCLIIVDCIFDVISNNKQLTAEVIQNLIQGFELVSNSPDVRVGVVILTGSPSDVPERIRNRFGNREVSLPTLNSNDREKLLRGLIQSIQVSKNLNVSEISKNMPGAVVGDVVGMVRNALTACLAQIMGEHGIQNQNQNQIDVDQIVLSGDHFQVGEQSPSALRELRIDSPNVSWDEIGGLAEAKLELQEFCKFNLERKKDMEILGLKPGRGVLLYGPPGCGKTMMGKALASQSGANFVSVQGPELLNRWFGESERAVREVL
eukprot:TRINITY_DN2218_c3_g2_i1.p1 TRINITY_DN2218_c3_g2~~TRINITY_DN2218_c3_g2_i1.p1  ORF type:complete len:507 (+),score=98.92 TRINITY_DN2218_c3_g2_i1:104-1624(+)